MVSEAQIRQFIEAPQQFLRSNSVKWRGMAPENQCLIEVGMIDAGGRARFRTGSRFAGFGNAKANARMYELRWAGSLLHPLPPGTTTFSVQWSGYKAGQARDARLPAGDGPGLMLTPEFSGCTAVCRTFEDGSALFSHYNLMQGAHTLDDRDMRAIGDAAYGGEQRIMTKGDMRARGKHSQSVLATVVGVRRHGRWEFWAQYREDKQGVEQIRAVERL